MLNLRQHNKANSTETNSDAQHFSRFSIDFGVRSDLLGDIGEPLDHSQSERLHEDEPGEHEVTVEESEASPSADLESARSAAGPSGARWEDEDRAQAGTVDVSAGPSVAGWNDRERASLDGAVTSAGMSGTRGDEVGDALHASDYMDGADTKVDHLIEEVRLFLYLGCCSL